MLHTQQERGERSFFEDVVKVPPQLHKHAQPQKMALCFKSADSTSTDALIYRVDD